MSLASGGPGIMKAPRWVKVGPSSFDWEREALDFLCGHLPDHEPWRAWSNFEFIDDEGRVNEVEALVLTPSGLALVEIKSRPVPCGVTHILGPGAWTAARSRRTTR